ncbi:TspO/MBR family protein [Alkalicoccus chagannorensis]|uniref:TspO/MBR family protein n=1 Tax=Alkalicoccus chagannorensis TaxID=427072 RepID=UPI00041302E6|nr:TspO/MBR family protein [Alkalicoccus chagannorensis]
MERTFAWINMGVLLLVIAYNALANILPLNGISTGEASERVDVLFTPAGYVFSIWSVIYITLFIWAVRSLAGGPREDREAVQSIGWFFALNGLFNVTWLTLFHFEFYVWTTLPMILLFLTLVVIYRRIVDAGASWWTKVPFTLYLAWISVAMIVNFGIFFNFTGFENGWIFSDVLWTMLILPVGSVIALTFSAVFRNLLYPAVFLWAYIGIAVERWDIYPGIAWMAVLSAGLLVIGMILQLMSKKQDYA